MTATAAPALIELALNAALADGTVSEGERQILEGFLQGIPEPRPSLASIEEQVRRQRGVAPELVQHFATPSERRSAFEMCTAVCAADGPVTTAEQWFLDDLHRHLGLESAVVPEIQDAVTTVLPSGAAISNAIPVAPLQSTSSAIDAAALDKTILNHALIAGGLEILPDTLAAVAILPVQMKLVYQIGRTYGFELDRGHIQEFLGVLGVGVASQVIEHFATRLLGGLAGHFLGGLGRGMVGQATESAMAFATTYALGRAAQQYYAGGRKLNAIQLQSLFANLLSEARGMQSRYQPDIARQSSQLRGMNLASLARGMGL